MRKKTKLVVKAPKRFGKLIRTLRKQYGWTQPEVAETIGYTFQHVSAIELGHPHLDTPGVSANCVIQLCRTFRIPQRDYIKRVA